MQKLAGALRRQGLLNHVVVVGNVVEGLEGHGEQAGGGERLL